MTRCIRLMAELRVLRTACVRPYMLLPGCAEQEPRI